MKRVAIVEDDVTIAEMYQFKLQQSGYDVAIAHDGQAGLEIITSFKPQLVLLDLMLPLVSGDQLLQKIRATEWGKSIKVVVMTNISEGEADISLKGLNVERYIIKAHYTPSQITEIVDEILSPPKKA